ncbi:MAG: lathosterol oxidase [Glaciecola sp.]|jgi:lathosterol oxidase
MEKLINNIITEYSYLELFLLSFIYFFILYFLLGPLFKMACEQLEKRQLLYRITERKLRENQTRFEILHSLKSIVVFGFSIVPIIYLFRNNYVEVLPSSCLNICLGVLLLTSWNEIHFYISHKVLHLPYFMNKIHYIHHYSTVPTVYSVYSFHWIEALILSTVPLTIILFIPIPMLSMFIYPLISILLNFAGHCNFRIGNGNGHSLLLFGSRHNRHHVKGYKNYGFVLDIFDKLFSNRNKS